MGIKGRIGLCLFLFLVISVSSGNSQVAFAQSPTSDSPKPESIDVDDLRLDHTPKGALWRAAALPGWGQIYNRQYLKLPFVYAALGTLVYTAITNHQDYILYREAFQYKAFQEQVDSEVISSNPRSSFKGSYDKISAQFGAISSRPLEAQRNIFRRSRDLSFVGVGLVYGLAMLDAYVSAHLMDFDVGENLSIQVAPYPGGFSLKALVPLERRAHRSFTYQ